MKQMKFPLHLNTLNRTQFGGQEPGSNEQIAEFCTLKHQITFPMFAKVDVNGPATSPLYTFLKSQKSGDIGYVYYFCNDKPD